MSDHLLTVVRHLAHGRGHERKHNQRKKGVPARSLYLHGRVDLFDLGNRAYDSSLGVEFDKVVQRLEVSEIAFALQAYHTVEVTHHGTQI